MCNFFFNLIKKSILSEYHYTKIKKIFIFKCFSDNCMMLLGIEISHLYPYISLKIYTYLESRDQNPSNDIR